MPKKFKAILVGILLLFTFLVFAIPIFSLNNTAIKNTQVNLTLPCEPRYSDECSRLKATIIAQDTLRLKEQEKQNPVVVNTPLVTFLPMTEPAWAKEIQPIKLTRPIDGSWKGIFQSATSVWKAGGVARDDKAEWYEIYIWAGSTRENSKNVIGRLIGGASPEYTKKYQTIWTPNQNLAAITITAITSPSGIISFSDANGITGNLDTTTGVWTFGAIVLTSPSP